MQTWLAAALLRTCELFSGVDKSESVIGTLFILSALPGVIAIFWRLTTCRLVCPFKYERPLIQFRLLEFERQQFDGLAREAHQLFPAHEAEKRA